MRRSAATVARLLLGSALLGCGASDAPEGPSSPSGSMTASSNSAAAVSPNATAAGTGSNRGPYPIGPEGAGLQAYWPTDDWRGMEPAMLGFDPAKLEEALAYNPHDLNTQALLVIRHGYIAAEKYFGDFTQTSRHQSFSMAKSVSSALLGIALAEGKIPSVDEKLCKYYPSDWDCNDPSDKHSTITIHHAMTLTTGLEWSEDSADLVLVRLADDGYSGIEIWDADVAGMVERVLDALL